MMLREELIKIGAKVVTHAKTVMFHLAEVAVPRTLFAAILDRSAAAGAGDGPSAWEGTEWRCGDEPDGDGTS